MTVPTVLVVIQSDPLKTHRPVEGLRVALGLSTGAGVLTIILIGQARTLLTEVAYDAVAAEVLEKHLPVVRELHIDIVVPDGSSAEFSMDAGFTVREVPQKDIVGLCCSADRVLVF